MGIGDARAREASRKEEFEDLPSADAEQEIAVRHDGDRMVYSAWLGDLEVAELRYTETGGRVVVRRTTVVPEFRGRGIATDLIADALDDLRRRVGRVSVECPLVAAFMTANPQYADLLDPE
ncbi:GNAT family N-acetyltransferase [Agromyces aurantiacus]|uniref:GNAT family N-acetyltransferase n=1 Tax=Agromyces aurantiacus TaxID=165814 RepID=A0ABV9R6W1_9MICO|nr:GNAT family N-acetyltransferase [Agromyces aurantiacus]MBM7503692.1 putative GNAT family acetyltransferase [Agromyces aurantiacus]